MIDCILCTFFSHVGRKWPWAPIISTHYFDCCRSEDNCNLGSLHQHANQILQTVKLWPASWLPSSIDTSSIFDISKSFINANCLPIIAVLILSFGNEKEMRNIFIFKIIYNVPGFFFKKECVLPLHFLAQSVSNTIQINSTQFSYVSSILTGMIRCVNNNFTGKIFTIDHQEYLNIYGFN